MTIIPNALNIYLNFKNHHIDSKILLYGIPCSAESILVLMILITLYLQRHTQSSCSLCSIILGIASA